MSSMSLVKLLKAPIKLFKKDVITFVMIRRYDLGVLHDRLRYIAVKPFASISVLRQKVWHLLDLPDYCEEVIILKTDNDQILPLYDLRKGNDPHHPYILEVWGPRVRFQTSTGVHNKMLTIENGETLEQSDSFDDTQTVNETIFESKCPDYTENGRQPTCSTTTISNDSMVFNKFAARGDRRPGNILNDFKKSDLPYAISTCSLFKKKSRENFANIFMKIQNDLSSLNMKLSSLENRLPK